MKKRMKTHHQPISRWRVHDATLFGVPVSTAYEEEAAGLKHLNAATFPAEVEPIHRESRIMKFLRNL